MDSRGRKTGKETTLRTWYLDIQSATKPGAFAPALKKAQWSMLKTFKDKGYTLLPSTESADSLNGLAENDLEFNVALFCQADSQFFCTSAIILYRISKDSGTGELMRNRLAGYAPPKVTTGSSPEAAAYYATVETLRSIPNCQK
jgi:hypothetical protein